MNVCFIWIFFFFKEINIIHRENVLIKNTIFYFYSQKELDAAIKFDPTATEQLIELFKAQQLANKTADDSTKDHQDAESRNIFERHNSLHNF
jgi:hypothetical protein